MDALAHAYISLYDWPAAVQTLNEIIAIWPHKAETHSNLGSIYQAMGRMQDAITAYEAALKINPRLAVTLNSLGSAYLSQGDFENAERCYRQCLAATGGPAGPLQFADAAELSSGCGCRQGARGASRVGQGGRDPDSAFGSDRA